MDSSTAPRHDSRAEALAELRAMALPLLPTAIAAATPLLVGTPAVGLRYYEAVAQIIPLMLVVLILEHRYFFRRYRLPPATEHKSERANRWQDRLDRWVVRASPVLLLVILASGEWVALAGLASGDPDTELFQITVAALLGGFAAICLLAMTGVGGRSGEKP